MNATVNDACIGCGLCAGVCPEVFSMGDDGFAHGGDVPGVRYTSGSHRHTGSPSREGMLVNRPHTSQPTSWQ